MSFILVKLYEPKRTESLVFIICRYLLVTVFLSTHLYFTRRHQKSDFTKQIEVKEEVKHYLKLIDNAPIAMIKLEKKEISEDNVSKD
jgi:hypothetical protein